MAVLRLARRATHYNWETVGSTKQWAAPNCQALCRPNYVTNSLQICTRRQAEDSKPSDLKSLHHFRVHATELYTFSRHFTVSFPDTKLYTLSAPQCTCTYPNHIPRTSDFRLSFVKVSEGRDKNGQPSAVKLHCRLKTSRAGQM